MPAAETSTFDDVTYAVATLIVPEGINVATLPQPWVSFANKQSGTETYTNQCAKPTISYDKGKLKYATTTEGATIISEVVVADAKQSNVAEVTLTKEYVITVYAKKAGLADSEKVTATIKWCNGRPTMSGFTNVKLEENPLRGDVNEDGVVSITDAVSVVNLILGTNTSGAPAMEPEVAEPEDAVEPE